MASHRFGLDPFALEIISCFFSDILPVLVDLTYTLAGNSCNARPFPLSFTPQRSRSVVLGKLFGHFVISKGLFDSTRSIQQQSE